VPDLSQLRWTNAKTYPDAPHEYVLRDRYPEVFAAVQALLKGEGVKEKFTLRGRTSTYRYYYAGGYKYWIMGQVLNRAKIQSG
jgi:hypothetical protein